MSPWTWPFASASIRNGRIRWCEERRRLPHGTGKKLRVLVFAKGEKEQEARQAGADFVGADDLMEKIKGGWMDFDWAISTPDLMASSENLERSWALEASCRTRKRAP